MNINGINVADAVNAGKDVLVDLLKDLIRELRPKMSLEDIQRLYTKTIDQLILKEEYDSDVKYVGGEFSLNYLDDDHYDCGYNLFFMDKNKKITELSAKSKPVAVYYLNDETREELKRDKNIKFEIPAPSDRVRDKFNQEKSEKHFS